MKSILFSSKNFASDLSLLLMRWTFGGLMLVNHGIGKIAKLNDDPVKFMDFMGLGPEASLALVVFAEALCSVLVIAGAATRLATIPLVITMLVAIFKVKGGQDFSEIELPLFYLMGFIILFITGAGKYSVDGMIYKG